MSRRHNKTRFIFHLVMVFITGGLWLIPMGIWFFVKKS